MSDKARKLIKGAVKAYLEEDGASELGAYRDIVTDLLHLAYKDRKVTKGKKDFNTRCLLKDSILIEGDSMFEEEIVNAELDRIAKIPKNNLPLYLNKEWETQAGLKMYQDRLKGN